MKKLAESNFEAWNADVAQDAEAVVRHLDLHVEHIRDGRSAEDLLWEILLKSGFSLTTPIEALTLEAIRAIAERRSLRVVLLDEGFAKNDQLKANAVQIFRIKGVTSFRTV